MSSSDLDEQFKTDLIESFNLFGNIKPWFFGGYDSMGNFFNTIQSGGATPGNANFLLYLFASPMFNRLQRWIGRYLYKTSPYAIAGIDALADLVLGSGLKYVAADESQQDALDEWLKTNKWCAKEREAFIRMLVDGETFIRLFDTTPRFLDPDLIYGDTPGDEYANGIVTNPDDYEDVIAYVWDKQEIPADEIQHRKMCWTSERRGTSWLFPIADHVINSEALLSTIMKSASIRGKFGMVRKWNSPQEAVNIVKSDITTQVRKNNPWNQNTYDPNSPNFPFDTVDNYPDGAVADLPKGADVDFPAANLEADKYVEVLHAALRAIAARLHLPEFVLNGQGDMGAYNAALAAESPNVKACHRLQEMIIDYTGELLETVGFPDTEIIAPEISVHNKDEILKVAEFLKRNVLASDQTIDKMLEVDFDAEQELMKESPPTPYQDPNPSPNGEKQQQDNT